MNRNQKIKISVGAIEYLVSEVEQKRKQVELLSAENRVMNNFFKLVNGIMPQQPYGEGQDKLYLAKKEFESEIQELEKSDEK